MLSKTLDPKWNIRGFTLVELLIVIAIISILSGTLLFFINPSQARGKSRDNKRLSDLAVIERMIIEYDLSYRSYPDGVSVLRDSLTLPSTSSPSLMSSNRGWIDADLSEFNDKLPIDPVNKDSLKYEYYSNGTDYEINIKLEAYPLKMQNDNGNDPLKYEVGTDLNLISP